MHPVALGSNEKIAVAFCSFLFIVLVFPELALWLIKAFLWVFYNGFKILMSIALVMIIITIIFGDSWWMRL